MSITAMVWALKKAPVSEPVEALILVGLADHAGDDGADAYPSQALLAQYGRCSPSTVKRRLSSLEDAGLIQRGDQQKVAHLPANRRPIVWDLNLHVVTCAGQHAEDVIDNPEEILGGQVDRAVTSDTPETPNLGGSPVTDRSNEPPWGVTQDVLGGHGWTTNRPLTILKPSIGPTPAKPKGLHSIPEDFTVTDDLIAWAKEKAPAVTNIDRQTEMFMDHFRSSGKKYKDWGLTWKNWMRRAQGSAEDRGWKPHQGRPTVHPSYGWIEGNR